MNLSCDEYSLYVYRFRKELAMEEGNHTWWIAMVILLPVIILIGGVIWCTWSCCKKKKDCQIDEIDVKEEE